MSPPVVRDQRYMRQWVVFYMTLGYTEPQSEVLAEQLCSNCKRGDRTTVDVTFAFQKYRRSRLRIPQLLSLADIVRAISGSQ